MVGFRLSWRWAGAVAALAPIGSRDLAIFRLRCRPSLVRVQLCSGMKAERLGCAHSLHITSWKVRESLFTGAEALKLIRPSFFPLAH